MTSRPRIAVDAMGGDGGPAVAVAAAVNLASRIDLLLVGDSDQIRAHLPTTLGRSTDGAITIHHAPQQVTNGDTLADVLRRKPGTSMRQALLLHAQGEADAVVSAGDTAALMALSRLLLDMVPGIERPAICKSIQGMQGPFWMLDLGANIECSAEQFRQFARMGSAQAQYVGGIAAPRVALLNIGTETHKGPAILQDAAARLTADPLIDYTGFIEGNMLFSGHADVVVADGFAGNIALKSIEGAARMAGHLLRSWLESLNSLEQAGMALARSKLTALRHELNPQRYNGASFVGLTGIVLKSHGSADVEGFQSAVEQAALEVQGQVPARLAAQSLSG